MKVDNPWKQNPWFESVAVAQQRARKRLPQPVYGALVAGSERGQSIADGMRTLLQDGIAKKLKTFVVACPFTFTHRAAMRKRLHKQFFVAEVESYRLFQVDDRCVHVCPV